MASMVKNRTENDVLGMLVYAQKYEIKSLISTCIYEARRLTLQQLKGHGKRDQIEPHNYMQITEGIIKRLEEQCIDVKVTCQGKLQQVSQSLYNHGLKKGSGSVGTSGRSYVTSDEYFGYLLHDMVDRSGVYCQSLSPVAVLFRELNAKIGSRPSS